MRKTLTLAACIALSSFACAGNAGVHKSPAIVAARFAECMKNADFDGILELYAYHNDAIVKMIDPKAFALRLNALTPGNLPSGYYRITKIRMCANFSKQINNMYYTMLLPDTFENLIHLNNPVILKDNPEIIDQYLKALDTEKLKKLELVRMDIALPDLQKSERHQNIVARWKEVYQFDDKVEYTALYKLGDAYFEGGITFSKFGGKWYIDSLTSSLANIEPLIKIENTGKYLSDCKLSK
ncbi:MAG TPA: hypothetical protein PKK43_01610 [Spirochaetota bacterium]|nr:hypothetical protein [Spirochaetota bacterium]